MAAATLAMKVVQASLTKNAGQSANTTAGTTTLFLVIEATATAAAVPLATASKAVSAEDPQDAKGMIGKALTLNFDDVTGVITSLT
jgi:hypothetical protein